MSQDTQVAFSQSAYRQIIANLDAIMKFMMDEFEKSEDEAQAWMKEFVVSHYFPVWRAMNRDDAGTETTNGKIDK